MQNKLSAIFGTVHGWALILTFVIAGIKAIQSQGVSIPNDVLTILGFVGTLLAPVDMTAGRVISK